MTVEQLIEHLRHHGVHPGTEVLIDGCDRGGNGIELRPLLTRVRGDRLFIVADEVEGG